MEETKEIKVKKKKKLSKSGLIVLIGVIIIAIPCLVFAGILGIDFLQKSTPREGSRFKNDLTNKITDSAISELKEDLKTLSNIDGVDDVKLSQGQLKIYIDAKDSITDADINKICEDAFGKVNAKLPITTYFTKNSDKNYDLQINVYTTTEDVAGRQYKILHKNSSEEKYGIDDMVHPKDPALVSELKGETTHTNEDVDTETPEEE